MALDDELEKAKKDLENNPLLSRKDYEVALKAMAEKHNMTVEEFKRMLDKEVAEMSEDISGNNLRELWEKGLPPQVLKELGESKALYPTLECLRPHELNALGDDRPLQISGKQLLERVRHVVQCQFCRGLASRCWF